ncbi:hypothetical protein AURDEDRAFT_163867 [Auricularia subglabra TFB-10046 SS5]|nr:hypothetical protein AURDEDRAFT_163867 [Auricularia subglabra TFB-10046 SS5]
MIQPNNGDGGGKLDEDSPVDVVVVDRDFHLNGTDTAPSTTASRKSTGAGSHPAGGMPTGTGTGSQVSRQQSFFSRMVPRSALAGIRHFFEPGSELQPSVERQYQKEQWHLSKRLALMCSLFFVVNWALGTAFVPRPLPLADKIFYYGIGPVISLPLPFLVAWNFPRDHNFIYQVYLAFAIWSWATYMTLFMNLCGLYGTHQYFGCNGKDFLGLFYYTTALQTIGLFALAQNRTGAVISAVSFLIVLLTAVVPHKASLARQTINFIIYQVFLIYAHYKKENSDRRLYHMREELKNQYRATQKAQVAERKAGDSKRRLTSYIFHEVRVPLNTALLATQNMEAGGAVPRAHEIEFHALQGSLGMMSKVLNDVLDFNRMDAGRFESVARPYALHTVLQSMFAPLKLAAEAKGLEAHIDLDPRIDVVAREASGEVKRADGEPEKASSPGLDENGAGIVIGDEMRLRQIVTNLTSNATKFTAPGGRIALLTRLVHPAEGSLAGNQRRMVVRIEVQDTGVGIRGRDLADGGRRLFSPYVQTEIGRVQGGKGSGLGLALVRHIVRLSHGRLGVRSTVGEGSTFWVELALGVGVHPDNAIVLAKSESGDGGRTSEGGNTMSDGSAGGMLFNVTKQNVAGGRLAASGVAEFERAMLARRPDPVLEEPPVGVNRPTSRRSSARKNSYDRATPLSGLSGATMLGQRSVPASPSEEMVSAPSMRSVMPPSLGSIPPPSTVEPPPLHDLTPLRHSHSPGFNFTYPSSPVPGAPSSPPAQTRSALPTPESMPAASGGASPTSSSPFIPAPAPPPPAPAPAPAPTSPPPGLMAMTATGMGVGSPNDNRLRVLVVDDDGLTRRLMGRMLARLGCVVDTAEHGQQALDMLLADPPPGTEPYAVTFLDNQMHVMSGLQMIARLRALGRQDFVVGVTGNALLSDQEEYMSAGVDHVLTKPVIEHSLLNMLGIARERRQQLRRSRRADSDAKTAVPNVNEGPTPEPLPQHDPQPNGDVSVDKTT